MEPTNTELSGRTAAIFSWIDFLAIILIILSATALSKYGQWLQLAALIMLLSNFIYRIVGDLKAGRRTRVRYRLISVCIIIVFVAILLAWQYLIK
jgi:hypothetical protein